ncbi:MAG TPA: ABC transporter substrate-binding protein [Gemmatimonadaceae bacterium]|nr:ABC transporter substrate-binding protein [Gemmatimonadaceae bacterium]
MRRPLHPLRVALLAGAALAGAACGRGEAPDAGKPRVVSVSKQINEFLYAMGAQDVLVARDLTSIYPPAIRQLPSVGYHRALSADGIISVKPTLFLTDGNVGPDAVLDQLRTVGIPILLLKPGSTPDSAEALLARLGREFHRERAADSVLAEWRRGMERVRADSARLAAVDPRARPRVLVMHFGQLVNDYLAVGRGGPADRMIAWAGGVNAIDSAGGMTRLTPELIAKAAPDVIIATDVGFDRVGSVEKFAALPGVSLTPAAKSGRIHRIDETEIMYFGPRTPAAARVIASWLHAEGAAASH